MQYRITVYHTDGTTSKGEWHDKEPELSTLQAAVGGYIEAMPTWAADEYWRTKRGHAADAEVYCNEDGKAKDLNPNPFFSSNGFDQIVGDVVVKESKKEGV